MPEALQVELRYIGFLRTAKSIRSQIRLIRAFFIVVDRKLYPIYPIIRYIRLSDISDLYCLTFTMLNKSWNVLSLTKLVYSKYDRHAVHTTAQTTGTEIVSDISDITDSDISKFQYTYYCDTFQAVSAGQFRPTRSMSAHWCQGWSQTPSTDSASVLSTDLAWVPTAGHRWKP